MPQENPHSLLQGAAKMIPTEQQILAIRDYDEAVKTSERLWRMRDRYRTDPETFYKIDHLQNLAMLIAMQIGEGGGEASSDTEQPQPN